MKNDIRTHGIFTILIWLILKPLPVEKNFVSVELKSKTHHDHLAAGAIRFQKGHQVIGEILKTLKTEFSGVSWGANGPLQLTKAMRRYCKDTNWSESSGSRVECGDVTIFSQDYFYPINWRQWFWLYKTENSGMAMSRLNQSFIAHLWASHARGSAIQDNSALTLISSTHCPLSSPWIV